MPALKKKITSERGASITFSLLLFLVCAIISSVVIVAATAVGGRASKLAEMDQRYYAVNSAAELIRDELEGTKVTVVTGTKTTSTVDQNMDPVTGKTPNEVALDTEVEVDDVPLISIDNSLITTAALQLANVPDPSDLSGSYVLPTSLNLTVADSSGNNFPSLAVTIEPNLDIDNQILTLYISNTAGNNGVYTLELTFKADQTQSTDSQTTYGTPDPVRDDTGKMKDGEYTMDMVETKKNITNIRWKLINLMPVTKPASTSSPTSNPTSNPGG